MLLAPLLAAAQESAVLDRTDALRASQAAVGRTMPDPTLLDREGRPVRLSAFRGRPLLVSFIYTGCFEVCPATTRALDQSMQALQARFGERQFNVVSIGFNQPADSPQAMKAFAAQHRIARPNWEFLSAPAAVVAPLTREFGFRYAPTPAGFDHVLQVSLVDAQGRIVRQVYGDQPAVDVLGDALATLVAGQPLPPQGLVGELVDRIRILCTVYDPKTGTYRTDYGLALEIAGGLTFILFVALYMLNEWRARRRERRRASLAARA
ncbi:MAG TPA: SCO family protein [Ramlibacter sp.]|uniref:SCO family protein n=1 Tax=Ramlibacter sp. TaxID=1917967 RepID=UPI002D7E2DAC|nr:SCO family protein [Ramlibacter sp.]HET8747960.1 SCO family protein [Ramlibacter sp.]